MLYYTPMDILKNLDLLWVGLAVITITILGFVVFLNNRKSITNKTFLLFVLIAIGYSIFNYLSLNGLPGEISFNFLKITIFLAVWYSFVLLRLFYVFPNENIKFSWFYKFCIFPITVFTSVLSLTPLVFNRILEFNLDGTISKLAYGPGIFLFVPVILSLVLGGIILLFRKTRKAKYVERDQLRDVLIGTSITYMLIILFNLILPVVFNNSFFVSYAPIFTLPFIIFTSYAILKHGLFNVKVIATELLVFALWILVLVRTLLSDRWQDGVLNGGLFVVLVVVGIFIIRSVQKEVALRERVEGLMKELNKSNDKLWVANEKLQELDKLKTEFVSMATHQLRSPLTAIKGYASMVLENSFGPVEEKARGAVDIIFQSSEKLVKVIEDFLNITRIELGTMKYDQSELNFKELVENVSKELRVNIEKKGLQFSFEADPAGDYKLVGDSGKLSQVVGNLIDNAIKYTPKGEIKVRLSKIENKIRLEVADTGVGIPAEVIPKLFQKFTRADDAGKVNISGTGLGLYVAKQIVEAHNGRIWAESDGKGKGSRFVVEL